MSEQWEVAALPTPSPPGPPDFGLGEAYGKLIPPGAALAAAREWCAWEDARCTNSA